MSTNFLKMNDDFNRLISEIIRTEGGYVDNPDDPGGTTKFGITEKVARTHSYTGDMQNLPRQLAFDIYYQTYIIKPNFHLITRTSELIAHEIVDTAVNCGVSRAAEFFQQTINKLNRGGQLFNDIKVDSAIGPKTILAFNRLLEVDPHDEKIFLKALNIYQGYHYLSLGQWSESFIRGWLDHRVVI